MRVLICGGGVIGAATAYFSSLKRAEVVVIERTGVACAASGKSGVTARPLRRSPDAASSFMPNWRARSTANGVIDGSRP